MAAFSMPNSSTGDLPAKTSCPACVYRDTAQALPAPSPPPPPAPPLPLLPSLQPLPLLPPPPSQPLPLLETMPPPAAMSQGQAVRYVMVHLDHRRRMQLHAAYARHLILGSATSSDLAAQAVAGLFACAAAGLAWMGSHSAGYSSLSQAALVFGSGYATCSALWPAEPLEPPTDSEGGFLVPGAANGPRWVRWTRRWLARARRHLKRDHEKVVVVVREEEKEKQARIGESPRAFWLPGVESTPATDHQSGAGSQAWRPPAAADPSGGGNEIALPAAEGPAVARLLALPSAATQRVRVSHLLQTKVQPALAQAAEPLVSSCTDSASFAFYTATAIQLVMAANAARDFHICVANPPGQPAAFVLLLACSLVPLVDTLALYAGAGKDRLVQAAPNLQKPIDALLESLSHSIATAGRAIDRAIALALDTLEEAMKALIELSVQRKMDSLGQRGGNTTSTLSHAPGWHSMKALHTSLPPLLSILQDSPSVTKVRSWHSSPSP